MTRIDDEQYPSNPYGLEPPDCPAHPDSSVEWDGYCFICIGCILAIPLDDPTDEIAA